MGLDFIPTQSTQDINAPLDILNSKKYSTNSFSYPLNIGLENEGLGHYVVFFINQTDGTTLSTIPTGQAKLATFNDPNEIPSINNQGINTATNTRRRISRIATAISLYMPSDVGTTYGTTWANEDLGLLGNLYKAGDQGSLYDAFMSLGSSASQSLGAVLGSASDLNITGTASQALRMAINPHSETLFNGVPFRTFTFSFKMVPRSQDEATVIDNIVRAFAFHSAAEIKPGGGKFFTYPSEFDIKFYNGHTENTYINRISTCALTAMKVSYTGSGNWSAMRDGAPQQTNIDLVFTELEIMHKHRILQGY